MLAKALSKIKIKNNVHTMCTYLSFIVESLKNLLTVYMRCDEVFE